MNAGATDVTAAGHAPAEATPPAQRRILALDGVRGLMTLLVVVSHYFAELPGGLSFFAFGWLAVDMFFVLSGLLVGRLIEEKHTSSNFIPVFFVRRVCRTFPIYFICLAASLVIGSLVLHAPASQTVPVWSYFVFLQNIFMAAHDDIGVHFLSPTWTLAVEEHFYLIVPFIFLFVPKKHLLPVLILVTLTGVAYRAVILAMGYSPVAALAVLPGRADILMIGVIAALVLSRWSALLTRHLKFVRIAPIAFLFIAAGVGGADLNGRAFVVAGHTLVAIGCAAFLLSLVLNAPEAVRMKSRLLTFFGDTSYAVYLTHLPTLWAMHSLILGGEPGIQSLNQCLVTFAAIPVCILTSWLLTKWIEMPITNLGRRMAWRNSPPPGRTASGAPRNVHVGVA